MKLIGLMSGTSLDGLDIAYCDIEGCYLSTKVKLLCYEEVKMPVKLKEKIQHACDWFLTPFWEFIVYRRTVFIFPVRVDITADKEFITKAQNSSPVKPRSS